MTKPVLFVTNHAPPFRVGAFAKLHEREGVTFALVGGEVRHGGGTTEDAVRSRCCRSRERDVHALAASGAYRAVVAGLSGRLALPSAYAGARAGARAVRAVGDDLGAPAHGRARALLSAAAPPLPPRRRDRDLRPSRLGLRALEGRAEDGRRGSPDPSTTRIGTDNRTQFGALSSRRRLSAE